MYSITALIRMYIQIGGHIDQKRSILAKDSVLIKQSESKFRKFNLGSVYI